MERRSLAACGGPAGGNTPRRSRPPFTSGRTGTTPGRAAAKAHSRPERRSGRESQGLTRCRAGRLRAAGIRGEPITVVVKPGVYPMTEPVTFLPEDSGGAGAPITYGRRAHRRGVHRWPCHHGLDADGAGILWKARVPGDGRDWTFRQLFVNGQRRRRARMPETGMLPVQSATRIDTSGWAVQSPPPRSATDGRFSSSPATLTPSGRT